MKKHLTKQIATIKWQGTLYAVPVRIIKKYEIKATESQTESIEDVFGDIISEYGEPGVLLRGLRNKEGLTQIEFAEAIGVTQQNLSAMENGRRNIGKDVAKRIADVFGVDYRIFL